MPFMIRDYFLNSRRRLIEYKRDTTLESLFEAKFLQSNVEVGLAPDAMYRNIQRARPDGVAARSQPEHHS